MWLKSGGVDVDDHGRNKTAVKMRVLKWVMCCVLRIGG